MDVIRVPVLTDNYSYILRDEEQDLTAVVDPGEARPVLAMIRERGWGLDLIINTHHHRDHVGGNAELKREMGCTAVGPSRERDRIPDLDDELSEDRPFAFGAARARVLFTPGHTSGHVSLFFEDEKLLFCGDVLFAMGCGRLFEGTAEEMWRSLDTLRALPVETIVHCGHEYTWSNGRFAVTVEPGNEKLRARCERVAEARAKSEPTVPYALSEDLATNPFLRPESPEIRDVLGLRDAKDVDVFAELRRRKDSFRDS